MQYNWRISLLSFWDGQRTEFYVQYTIFTAYESK